MCATSSHLSRLVAALHPFTDAAIDGLLYSKSDVILSCFTLIWSLSRVFRVLCLVPCLTIACLVPSRLSADGASAHFSDIAEGMLDTAAFGVVTDAAVAKAYVCFVSSFFRQDRMIVKRSAPDTAVVFSTTPFY